MESVLCGVSGALQWCIDSGDGNVSQLREFSLPAGPGLEDVRREVRVVPAPLLCSVLYIYPSWIVLAGEHFIYVPHGRGVSLWGLWLVTKPIRWTMPLQTKSQLLWVVALLSQPQLRAFRSCTGRKMRDD